jgi:hypothetical protein
MKNLKIGMRILATTTCMLDNEVFKLHPTTLVDAYEPSNQKKLKIELGKGHWGACPTRDRDKVCINAKEVTKLANSSLERFIEKHKNDKPKSNLFYVSVNNTHSITISMLRYSHTVNSMANGTFTEYRGTYTSMRINDKLPTNHFYTIEDAIKCFSKSFSF